MSPLVTWSSVDVKFGFSYCHRACCPPALVSFIFFIEDVALHFDHLYNFAVHGGFSA